MGVAKLLDVRCCANDGVAGVLGLDRSLALFVSRYVNTLTERLREVVASGNGQPNLNTALIGNIEVLIPPRCEIESINAALDDLDGMLVALDALIAKKRAVKTAAMQRLLTGRQRLPGFEGAWDDRAVGDFTTCTAGGTPSTSVAHYWGGSIPWMSSGELHAKRVSEVEGRITDTGLANSAATLVPPQSVLIGLAGQGKTRGTVAMNIIATTTNQSIAAILPSPSFHPPYLYHNLDSRYDEIRSLSTGAGGRGGLNLRIISGLRIPFPPLDEQRAIGMFLDDMDAEIAALEARRDKTLQIKTGMMQELLTGRTRLVRPAAAEPARPRDAGRETTARSRGQDRPSKGTGHNWAIDEAVVLSCLADRYATPEHPIGRERRTKMTYLLRRNDGQAPKGYLKQAAGPYNPKTKYGGPEGIARKNGYVREEGRYKGFVASDNIEQARGYFGRWYGEASLDWLDQFRYVKTKDLGALTTVDFAALELRREGRAVTVDAVKSVLAADETWAAKLDQPEFSDERIQANIERSEALFGTDLPAEA